MGWPNRQLSVIACALLTGGILSWVILPVHGAAPLGEIMPLGDSITFGNSTSADVPGGYRDRLNTALKNSGYSFTFVGSHSGNPSPQLTADGQMHQEGHGDYQVAMITNNLNANNQPPGLPSNGGGFWITGTGVRGPVNPRVVLLHIGTNDIYQDSLSAPGGNDTTKLQARLRNLIAEITTLRPNANVIVSTLIPIGTNAAKNYVTSYNRAIQKVIVPDFIALGKHVSFVDNYKNFVDSNGNVLMPSLLATDGLHPTQAGYNLMGDSWAAGIAAIVPEPSAHISCGAGATAAR